MVCRGIRESQGIQLAQTQTKTEERLVQSCPGGTSDAQYFSGQKPTVICSKLQKL